MSKNGVLEIEDGLVRPRKSSSNLHNALLESNRETTDSVGEHLELRDRHASRLVRTVGFVLLQPHVTRGRLLELERERPPSVGLP